MLSDCPFKSKSWRIGSCAGSHTVLILHWIDSPADCLATLQVLLWRGDAGKMTWALWHCPALPVSFTKCSKSIVNIVLPRIFCTLHFFHVLHECSKSKEQILQPFMKKVIYWRFAFFVIGRIWPPRAHVPSSQKHGCFTNINFSED